MALSKQPIPISDLHLPPACGMDNSSTGATVRRKR